MPRNGSGIYSLPAGSTVVNGDTSDASDVNTPLADIAADLNVARPVATGGTGATNAADARNNLGVTLATLGGQAADATLTALAAYNTNGLLTQTAADTFTGRTITAGTGITVTNGNGVSGNPTVAVSGNLSSLAGLSLVNGDVLIATGANTVARLGIGTANQVLTVVSGVPAWATAGKSYTYGSSQATTSGTAFDFTGVPAGSTSVILELTGVSLSGTDNFLVQLGVSGGPVVTGYGANTSLIGAGQEYRTDGFPLAIGAAASAMTARIEFTLMDSNTWSTQFVANFGSAGAALGSGRVALGGALTQVRLTRTGTNTFDAGSARIGWR